MSFRAPRTSLVRPIRSVKLPSLVSWKNVDRRPYGIISSFISGDIAQQSEVVEAVEYKVLTTIHVNSKSADGYIGDGSEGRPFRTISSALEYIDRLASTVERKDTCYCIRVGCGDYDENIVIGNLKYLAIESFGAVLSGSISIIQDEYSGDNAECRIDFIGASCVYPNRYEALTIDGNISLLKDSSAPTSISFSGVMVTGNITAQTAGIWRTKFMSSMMTGMITAKETDSVILLECNNGSVFTNPISGNITLYNCDHSYFNCDIEIEPTLDSYLIDMRFLGNITISGDTTVYVDLLTLNSLLNNSPVFDGVTLSQLDFYANDKRGGIIRLATIEEVEDGTADNVAVTPYTLENKIAEIYPSIVSSVSTYRDNDSEVLYWMGA